MKAEKGAFKRWGRDGVPDHIVTAIDTVAKEYSRLTAVEISDIFVELLGYGNGVSPITVRNRSRYDLSTSTKSGNQGGYVFDEVVDYLKRTIPENGVVVVGYLRLLEEQKQSESVEQPTSPIVLRNAVKYPKPSGFSYTEDVIDLILGGELTDEEPDPFGLKPKKKLE